MRSTWASASSASRAIAKLRDRTSRSYATAGPIRRKRRRSPAENASEQYYRHRKDARKCQSRPDDGRLETEGRARGGRVVARCGGAATEARAAASEGARRRRLAAPPRPHVRARLCTKLRAVRAA